MGTPVPMIDTHDHGRPILACPCGTQWELYDTPIETTAIICHHPPELEDADEPDT